MENQKSLIGKKFKEIRKNARITQDAFSELLGLETSSLSNIETGKSYPSMQTVINVIKKFNVDPTDIFDYEYFNNEQYLENEINNTIKKLDYKKKQILYKIIKAIEI